MLIRVGEVLDNPVTGERGVVRVAPGESNGYRLVADVYVRPGGAVSGEHVHPSYTESYTLVRGRLAVRRDGRGVDMDPGMRPDIPPGMPHDFWNAGPDEARFVLEVQPAGRFLPMIRNLFLLAQEGKTDAKGRPGLLQGVAFGREFADTCRFTSPPQAVQQVMFAVLGPLARLAGRRGSYPEYLERELPVVTPEPLPRELADVVPGPPARTPGPGV
jgi:mannose-6-phosphate isomerase-like protein (cupin superfamily)